MTDNPDRGMPMAGRRPPPDDEPTVPTTPPRARDEIGEATTVLRPQAGRPASGEETTRLQPPADNPETGTAGSVPTADLTTRRPATEPGTPAAAGRDELTQRLWSAPPAPEMPELRVSRPESRADQPDLRAEPPDQSDPPAGQAVPQAGQTEPSAGQAVPQAAQAEPAAGQTTPQAGPAEPEAGPAPSPAEQDEPPAAPPGSPEPPPDPDGGSSSEQVTAATALPAVPEDDFDLEAKPTAKPAPWRRLSSAGALIWVLLALFGFTLVVQLRSNDGDQGLASARQEDLVRILSDLESRDSRLQTEISALETSQRQLTSGVAGRQAALAEAEKRTDELGLLAGTLRGRGPGLQIEMDKVKASAVLNTVQELRGSGGEVMEIAGANGNTVRIVASSYFVDAEGGGLVVDGSRLTAPYTVRVIGSPQIMQPALRIPGGVVESVNSGGGSVTMEVQAMVDVTTVRKASTLQYARPVS